ncbi:hypothetical protein HU200_012473 [Digitaria exilis]|uniref:Uncharacterized protein n=1 Tax=Digitaria exilis TaxID=1010633 RepID=A0A835FEX5_9POAL|nr:hypothetical protein HU200_012473 [Digitaria exilis]
MKRAMKCGCGGVATPASRWIGYR